jgi:CRP-like cAMP-binding protein
MDSLLKNIRYCISLSLEEEEIIKKLFHYKVFNKSDYLLEEGNISRYLAFIDKGLVRYYQSNLGEEKTYYFNKEGEWIGDYQSFIPRVPSTTNIQALEKTYAWIISYEDLQIFYAQVKQGERFGRITIEQVFINTVKQISSLYTDKPELRYEKFIQKYFDISQRIPQYYIASYVGVKPQSLSRIRKRFSL